MNKARNDAVAFRTSSPKPTPLHQKLPLEVQASRESIHKDPWGERFAIVQCTPPPL